MSCLIRCKKIYEAKHEIVRILMKTKKREQIVNQYEDELRRMDSQQAKNYYEVLLKISCRLFNHIDRLRVDNPMLNRPFVYDG